MACKMPISVSNNNIVLIIMVHLKKVNHYLFEPYCLNQNILPNSSRVSTLAIILPFGV